MNQNMFAHIYDARSAAFGTDREAELSGLYRDVRQALETGGPAPKPRFLMFKVTDCCNSGCIYCDYAHNRRHRCHDSQDLLSTERFLQVLDQAAELGVEALAFNGGEALLRPDIIPLVAASAERRILPILMTNGLLLDRMWDSLGQAGLRYVILSLDTLDAEAFALHRGVSLEQTLRGLRGALDMREKYPGTVIHLTSVLTRHNLSHILPLADFCNEYRVWLEISVYDTYGQKEDVLSVTDEDALRRLCTQMIARRRSGAYISSSELYFSHLPDFCIRKQRTPDGYRCYSGYGILLLDDKLTARPCWGEDVVGSLESESLARLWNNCAMSRCRRMMLDGHCGGCWNLCTEFNALCTALAERNGVGYAPSL